MIRLFIYLLFFGALLYLFSWWKRQADGESKYPTVQQKTKRGFRSKKDPQEIWIQIYETESLEEARMLQARLQEEEVECVLYQQGKKDIHGNIMKGIGVAVPKTATQHAQGIVSRMPA